MRGARTTEPSTILNVGNGSSAAPQNFTIPGAAFGGEADPRATVKTRFLESANG